MAPHDTVVERTEKRGNYVEHVRVRKPDDDQYPCGFDYTLHYGTLDRKTLLRYDNAHERTKNHERHTPDAVEEMEFPGMNELVARFAEEMDGLPP